MSIAQSLDSLRSGFPALLEDIADGGRVFWTGSGISRGHAPMLPEVIGHSLEFLRDHINPANGIGDPHLVALVSIAERFLASEVDAIRADAASWQPPKDLTALTNFYGEIFATHVSGMVPDYVLWSAANVPHAFGSPALLPGVDHYLIALLILEGNVSEIASGNWDGLIERAVGELDGGRTGKLVVRMTNDSFRTSDGIARLYKFHGCAVLALEPGEAFRPYLVGRKPDLAAWPSDNKFREVREKMTSLAKTRPTLFLGLSVQDYDLMLTLIDAGGIQPWAWDGADPAYLFAELAIKPDQEGLLERVYADDYAANATQIHDRSILGMYSSDVLAGLLVHSISEKLRRVASSSGLFDQDANTESAVREGIRGFEAELLSAADSPLALVKYLRHGLSATTGAFTSGPLPDAYQPIFRGTADQVTISDHPARERIPELAAILTILGLGASQGRWQFSIITGVEGKGLIEVRSTATAGVVRLAVVRDPVAANDVMASPGWRLSAGPVIMMQTSDPTPPTMTRSSSRGLGAGRAHSNQQFVWIEDRVDKSAAHSLVLDKFAEAIGV